MEAAEDSEEGGVPTSGPIAYGAGFHTETYPVYQAHQTQSQWLSVYPNILKNQELYPYILDTISVYPDIDPRYNR
jgi:hypothetical protein